MNKRLVGALRGMLAGLAAVALVATADAAGVCVGDNMLDELKSKDPGAHERIVTVAAATANSSALLWRIDKPGVRPSWLLGTIHLTDNRVTTFSAPLAKILAGVDKVALEIADLSAAATGSAMAKAGDLTMLGNGRRLDRMLSGDEFETVSRVLAAAGVPEVAARIFRPWVATMIMSVSPCERRNAAAGRLVLDAKIAEAARADRKPVVGLETVESQLAALASVPEDQQLAMLRAGIVYADRIDDQLETLLQLYLGRRIGAAWPLQLELADKAGIDRANFAAFEKLVVIDRNREMSVAMQPLLDDGNVLVAVGALHLPGKVGIVELLRAAGYTLTPLE